MVQFVSDLFTDVNLTRLENHIPDIGDVWEQVQVEPWSTNSEFNSAFINSNHVSGVLASGRSRQARPGRSPG